MPGWKIPLSLAICSALGCSPAQTGRTLKRPPGSADLVVFNGTIWTGLDQPERVQALAVIGQHIVYTGDNKGAQAQIGPDTRVIDLAGRFAMPGFNDAHVHFLTGGFQLDRLDLRNVTSRDEFVRRVVEKAQALPPGGWLLGGNWDHENWPGGALPTREWIDAVTQGHPALLRRTDGHMALANSLALTQAGITRDTPDPQGGIIVRDEKTGEPTGILKDTAYEPVYKMVPAPSFEQALLAAQRAVTHANRLGITSVTAMLSYASDDGDPFRDLRVYQALRRQGQLTVRIDARLPIDTFEQAQRAGMQQGFGDDFLRVNGFKAFVDGSLGSSTAWFFEPYLNQPGNTGVTLSRPDALLDMLLQVDRAGYALAVHAIGDRANSFLLDAGEQMLKTNGSRDRRLRIEHAQHLRPEDFQRFARLGVIASVQPYHAIDDGRWAHHRIDPKRLKTSYAYRTFLDHGVRLAFGSDWVVAPLNPLLGVYAAVTRRTLDDKHPKGWYPEQRVSLRQALLAFGRDAAYAQFAEADKGSLQSGKLADLVILSRDPFVVDPDTIGDIGVQMTLVGGQVVYSASE